MTESNQPVSRGKPKLTLNRPSSPGSALMWAGLAVTVVSVLVSAVVANLGGQSDATSSRGSTVGSEPYDVSATAAAGAAATAATEGAKSLVDAGVLTDDQLKSGLAGTTAAIAAADAAAVSTAQSAGTDTATTDEDAPTTMQLNGVTVTLAAPPAWKAGQSGRQWMYINSGANVICQLTARSDATPGGVQQDAAGDEAKFEADFMATMLPVPGATRTAKLLFREASGGVYRYGVGVRLSIPVQGQAKSLEFVNAVAQQSSHMARVQCAARDMSRGADMAAAEQLVRSLHAK